MNKQCKFCIHSDVCTYKEHYEDAVELYEKTKYECAKYPYFVCDIRCIKYLKKVNQQECEKVNVKDIENDSIKMVKNAEEIKEYQIKSNEDILKGFEDFTKMMFKQGRAESEE